MTGSEPDGNKNLKNALYRTSTHGVPQDMSLHCDLPTNSAVSIQSPCVLVCHRIKYAIPTSAVNEGCALDEEMCICSLLTSGISGGHSPGTEQGHGSGLAQVLDHLPLIHLANIHQQVTAVGGGRSSGHSVASKRDGQGL